MIGSVRGKHRRDHEREGDERQIGHAESQHFVLNRPTAADGTGPASDALDGRVVGRYHTAGDRQCERGSVDSRAILDCGDPEDDHQRVHEDMLVPAEITGHQAEPFAKIEAAGSSDHGDEGASGEPAPRIDPAHWGRFVHFHENSYYSAIEVRLWCGGDS